MGLEGWSGFREAESKSISSEGTSRDTPRAEPGLGDSHGTGWACEQMQLCSFGELSGNALYIAPAMDTACSISYSCLTGDICKTLAHPDFLGSSVDLGKLLLICK